MQHLFSCTPNVLTALERTLSAARLGRYLPAAGGDRHRALRLYIWNVRLCEAFYLPCQIAEVSIRNSISRALASHYKTNQWYVKGGFRCLLPPRLANELNDVIADKQRDHGARMTHDHIIAGLSFGFWSQTLTKNFEHSGVWPAHIPQAFPHAPSGINRKELYRRVDSIRSFRNRIAHHCAIFDKSPKAMHDEIMEMIGWACPETAWLVTGLSKVSQTINARPRA